MVAAHSSEQIHGAVTSKIARATASLPTINDPITEDAQAEMPFYVATTEASAGQRWIPDPPS
jgi:hypothetical protein